MKARLSYNREYRVWDVHYAGSHRGSFRSYRRACSFASTFGW